MRKCVCAPMITLCLLLAGCGEAGPASADQLALDMRGTYLAMTGCEATLEMTADYGQRVYEYTLFLSYEKEGETSLTILAPEEVAGITARISSEGTALEYDGVRVETGPMDDQGLSPISAVPVLLETITQGFIAETSVEAWGEGESLVVTCRDPDGEVGVGREIGLWFDTEDFSLLQGEILSDGYQVIRCTVQDFSMTVIDT